MRDPVTREIELDAAASAEGDITLCIYCDALVEGWEPGTPCPNCAEPWYIAIPVRVALATSDTPH